MARLIDADALLEKAIYMHGFGQNKYIPLKAVENAPAADVEVVKHGRWLPQMLLGQRAWDCSECATLGSPHWKRCPVCEAKMDLEVTNGLDQH